MLPLELPQIDTLDSFNQLLVGWWMVRCGDSVPNLADPSRFHGVAKSGASTATYRGMPVMQFDGTANAYIDLGAAPLLNQSFPFTLAWWENPSSSSGASGAFVFCPSGTAQKFIVLRYDGANYNYLTATLCNRGVGGLIPRFVTAPSLASSVGVPRLWVLRGSGGMQSTTLSDYSLSVDGTAYAAGAAGNGLAGFTGAVNYIGWDSVDNNWSGWLGNVRLWRRVIGNEEIKRLRGDWMAGALLPDEPSRMKRHKAAT